MTLTDYLIECSRNTEIKVTDLSEVLVELKRIGNNINQIARKVNSKRFFLPGVCFSFVRSTLSVVSSA